VRRELSDVRGFFLHRPEISTLIDLRSDAAREDYMQRIVQRLPISVAQYEVLNIHRIGIRTPAKFAYEELLRWAGEAPHWPNHIATVESIDGSRRHIQILLFGRWTRAIRRWVRPFAPNFGTLFKMTALRIQHVPHPLEFDNARYLLYECSGGYPIGVFCIYLRSPVADQGEDEQTQLFFSVSFNFYGKKRWPMNGVVNKVWETIHNRVTANVLNRFKRLCEAEFQAFTEPSGVV
jgi:hypothetical protein